MIVYCLLAFNSHPATPRLNSDFFFKIMDGYPKNIELSASPKNVMTGFSQSCDPTPLCQILTFPSFLGTKNGPKIQLWSMTLKGKSAGKDFLQNKINRASQNIASAPSFLFWRLV